MENNKTNNQTGNKQISIWIYVTVITALGLALIYYPLYFFKTQISGCDYNIYDDVIITLTYLFPMVFFYVTLVIIIFSLKIKFKDEEHKQ